MHCWLGVSSVDLPRIMCLGCLGTLVFPIPGNSILTEPNARNAACKLARKNRINVFITKPVKLCHFLYYGNCRNDTHSIVINSNCILYTHQQLCPTERHLGILCMSSWGFSDFLAAVFHSMCKWHH